MTYKIPYSEIPYYSDLIIDYLKEKEGLKYAYHRFPSIENFEGQITEKQQEFSPERRRVLAKALTRQYRNTQTSKLTQAHIKALENENTFTITTGHQLNLFTGPLYFLYKIISVINLTKQLKKVYPAYHFVPIYWLASEDHDFEEINFFNFKSEKLQWNTKQAGAVGRFSTKGMDRLAEEFEGLLNDSDHAKTLAKWFREAYVEKETLTEATRYLGNALFGEQGLVIVDGDDHDLKSVFIPHVKNELLNKSAYTHVRKTADKLDKELYTVQVNPREINLFYLGDNARDRIVKEGNFYFLHGTEKRFTEAEILADLAANPESFSPNAIMRPLYQEVILPNLCYIGGSGELAYWLELKTYFEAEKIVFPSLLIRNSALLMTPNQERKLDRLGRAKEDLFLNSTDLLDKQTRDISSIAIDFSPQRHYLKSQFKELYQLADRTDKSFFGAVAAQEKKQLNGLDHLEKRLLKAQKRKLKDELDRLLLLQDQLFPGNNLQERNRNFSEFYEAYGPGLISRLLEEMDPLSLNFDVITL